MRHEWLVQIVSHLTDRDRQILDPVAVHQVFTTDQLCQMFFDNPTTARHRLMMYELRLLDRFAPYRPKGSAPYHYVLDLLGAHAVAAHRDVDAKQVGWRRPDGYGAWEQDDRVVAFFLEYDRHTEDHGRLARKLDGYANVTVAVGRRIPVLFCFGSRRREAGARRALADSAVTLATAVLRPGESPHEAAWLPAGRDGHGRCRLIDLAEPS